MSTQRFWGEEEMYERHDAEQRVHMVAASQELKAHEAAVSAEVDAKVAAMVARDLAQENAALRGKLKYLTDVIEAHEIESLSCDRDGKEYCDCLRIAAQQSRLLLANTTMSQPGGQTHE